MEDAPRTLPELEAWFPTEEDCCEYLASLRWPDGFRCHRCGYSNPYQIGCGLYECTHCGCQTSVTSGTLLHGTRKPLRLWFRAVWYVASERQGLSARRLQHVLGLGSYETAWAWLHKVRRAMAMVDRDPLAGPVEVDEVYVGSRRPRAGRRYGTGRHAVLVAAQAVGPSTGTGIKSIRLRRVPDFAAGTLCRAVASIVEPRSVVYTDGLPAYDALRAMGYVREVVREEAREGEAPLPRVLRVARALRAWMVGAHQATMRPSHLDGYLTEFTFRLNRRRVASAGSLGRVLLEQLLLGQPLPRDDLKASGRGEDGLR